MLGEEVLFSISNFADEDLIYCKDGKVYVGKDLLATINEEINNYINNYIKDNLSLLKKFTLKNEENLNFNKSSIDSKKIKNALSLKVNYKSRKYNYLLTNNKHYIETLIQLILNRSNWK